MAKAELHQPRNSRPCPLHNMRYPFGDRSPRGRCPSLRSTLHHESSRFRRCDNRSRSPPRDRLISHLDLFNRGVVYRPSCLGRSSGDFPCTQTKFVAGSVVQHGNALCSQDFTSALLSASVCHVLQPLPVGHVDRHHLQYW
jgi:hypothetical protein